MISEQLSGYIKDNLLDVIDWGNGTLTVKEFGKFLIIEDKNDMIFTDELTKEQKLQLHISEDDLQKIEQDEDIDYLLFQFGDRWFYSETMDIDELTEFKYLGTAQSDTGLTFPHLGIHGGFDLCNGSRLYADWCKKAKFVGAKTLGICEENTLAGTLSFQLACKKAGLKSIIGETVKVQNKDEESYLVKLYCDSQIGWRNLLNINSFVNVHNEGFITEAELKKHSEGIICVLTPEVDMHKKLAFYRKTFQKKLFFQFDVAQWDSEERDLKWLSSIKNYIEQYIDIVPPVIIADSYYLDKSDHAIRKDLNVIGKVSFKNSSKEHYFKSADEILSSIKMLFNEGDDDRFLDIIGRSMESFEVFEAIDFTIPLGSLHLPQYEMNEEQKAKYSSNDELFWALIEQGLESKILPNPNLDVDTYVERVQTETKVIIKGGFISYFLILWDIQNFCKERGIWTGIGRGSAAGCLVSYLLGIVKIDPIEYGLLFERFLNESRITKGLPDIDTDFQGSRRDEVKRYIEEKYGLDYVTSIGTFGTFKIRAALKDLARRQGADYKLTNYISGAVDEEFGYTDLFKRATIVRQLKDYIQYYPDLIEKLPLLLSQPKTASIHAAGVVIAPKAGGTIYDQIPVRKHDGVLVSEWEGEVIDTAGYLKCDILGIKQLDKFAQICDLIELHHGKRLTFEDMPLNDPEVIELFKAGLNEDVFQLGAAGLKGYCKQLEPESVEDLIATVALYRPGPIDIGAHNKYIKLKNGEEEPEYDFGTEEITKNTYGIYCYQEQIMKIVQQVGGLSLVEADEVRKAMGKKLADLMEKYKTIFTEGAVKNGCPREEAEKMWAKMEGFAGYAFNRSHAACYAITGYYCQWLKVHYPLEFWTVSLRFAKDDEVIDRILEIQKVSNKVSVVPVDINKSQAAYQPDLETNKIYWSITSIKWVGDAAVADIMKDRRENGMYFSIEEFCERTSECRAVNKRVVINLILAGAFDEVENVRSLHDRFKILEKFHNFIKAKMSEELSNAHKWEEYQWILKQKDLTGYGVVDYDKLVRESSIFSKKVRKKIDLQDIQQMDAGYDEVVVAGSVSAVLQKKTKAGKPFVVLEILDSKDTTTLTIWNEIYEPYQNQLLEARGKLIIMSGRVAEFRGVKSIHSNDKTKIQILGEASIQLTDSFTVKSVGETWDETTDGKSLYRKVYLIDNAEGDTYEWIQRADFNISQDIRPGQVWTGFIAYNDIALNHTDHLKLVTEK